MSKSHHLDQILEPDTVNELLKSLRSGVIDMAYFEELFTSDKRTVHRDYSHVPPEVMEEFVRLNTKARYTPDSQVLLDRELKIRLLQSIRLGRINISEYPEFIAARKKVKFDLSAYTQEELDFLCEAALTVFE